MEWAGMETTVATAQARTARTWLKEPARKYTAESAQYFEANPSANSIARLRAELACNCEPYRDVLTFARWKALGRSVRKGEKAHRLAVYHESAYREEGEPETVEHHAKVHATACVFCRCQTEPSKRQVGNDDLDYERAQGV